VITINRTDTFSLWLSSLKDAKTKGAITARITRASCGNFGDCRDVGDAVCEMRLDLGPGYRIYCVRDGLTVYLLLCGGDKSSQAADIGTAKKMWKKIKEERK
jgi:putative addiction module killer protein